LIIKVINKITFLAVYDLPLLGRLSAEVSELMSKLLQQPPKTSLISTLYLEILSGISMQRIL